MTGSIAASAHRRVKLIVFDRDHALATWDGVFIVWWRVHTTLPATERLRSELTEFCAAHQVPTILTIVTDRAPLPPADVRDRLAGVLREHREVRASAVVFEGSGFRAAAVRSVITGLTLIARQRFPHHIFASVGEAATWLSQERHAPDGDGPLLAAAVEHMRNQLDTLAGPGSSPPA